MNPKLLLPILGLLDQIPLPGPEGRNDFVELCAGEGHLSRALWSCGYHGKAFDVRFSKNHNLLRTVGFLTVLAAVRNIRPGGCIVAAPPCGTWVFLSSPSTGRTWMDPEGFKTKTCVLNNILVMRVLYILWYAWQRGVFFIWEQPLSSVMFAWKPVQMFLASCNARRVSFPMGSFGAKTMKFTTIWGTLPSLHSLKRPINIKQLREALARTSVSLVKKSIDKSGKRRIAGDKKKLADSAVYPRDFGMAVAALFRKEGCRQAAELDFQYKASAEDMGALEDFRFGKNAWWRKL
ncbi:Putative rhamnose biosynthetic enzyme 1 [Durusdinium trenchii]|uniref:Rhamnose biosynthetic enzyme 1 n=1 Tax=Durusdinium trenchii TaxID=1381693 RepID=A0ABP0KG52_9DINO